MALDADARKRLEELADAYDSGVVYIRTTRFSDYAKAIRALLTELDRLQGGEGWVLVPRAPTEAMIAACLSAVAEWRKTLTADEAILRRSEPTVQGRVFLASATPEEKAAIRWAAMLASRPDEPK